MYTAAGDVLMPFREKSADADPAAAALFSVAILCMQPPPPMTIHIAAAVLYNILHSLCYTQYVCQTLILYTCFSPFHPPFLSIFNDAKHRPNISTPAPPSLFVAQLLMLYIHSTLLTLGSQCVFLVLSDAVLFAAAALGSPFLI